MDYQALQLKYRWLAIGLLCSGLTQAMGSEAAARVAEARALAMAGDRESAAVLYHRVLQREDADRPVVGAALAALIVEEAQGFQGEQVESDILKALEGARTTSP